MNLGSEVRLEKLVELFVIILGEVNGFLLAPVLAVQDQVGVVVEDPLDLDVRILVDTAPLLEEPLDAGQPIEPSRVARDDLARLVSSRAMQRQERERQRSPDHHAALARRLACPRNGGINKDGTGAQQDSGTSRAKERDMEAKASKHASKCEHACARARVCVCERVRVRVRAA